MQRDIQSLTDHSTFLSGKIGFLLDAILGMLSIEQNAIIKIFSVAAVVFLPPTLIASIYGMNFKYLPEFDWAYGYPMALGDDAAVGDSAVRLFQMERLAVEALEVGALPLLRGEGNSDSVRRVGGIIPRPRAWRAGRAGRLP